MFSVKTLIRDDALVEAMKAMRTWLDDNRIEPTTFHYEFTSIGIECRTDFSREEAALGFATAFDGTLMTVADVAGPPETTNLGVSEILAELDVPLPEGDAAFAEAARRLSTLRARFKALYDKFEINIKTDAAEITRRRDRLEYQLIDYLTNTEPQTLAGAATKLRFSINDASRVLENYRSAKAVAASVLELIERLEAAPDLGNYA